MPKPNFIPYNKHLKKLAREMRNNPTNAERIFWYEILRNKNFFGLLFLRQKPLLHYIVDFYCSKLLLVIELDGLSHLGNVEYDEHRTRELGQHGIKVIRYFNNEIFEGLNEVSEDLEEKIKERKIELKYSPDDESLYPDDNKIPQPPLLKGARHGATKCEVPLPKRNTCDARRSPLVKGDLGDYVVGVLNLTKSP